MQIRLGRDLQYYYFFALSLILGILVAGGHYFWHKSSINSENNAALVEASAAADALKDFKFDYKMLFAPPAEIKTYWDKLAHELRPLKQLRPSANYKAVENSLYELKNVLQHPANLPQIDTLFPVLKRKASNFYEFVQSNHWRTLTRMSKRLTEDLNGLDLKNKSFELYEQINTLAANSNRYITVMKNVAEASTLALTDKKIISAKLNDLSLESSLLSKYYPEVKKVQSAAAVWEKNKDQWLQEVVPEIVYLKMAYERNTKRLVLGFFGLVLTMLLLMGLGLMVYRWHLRAVRRQVEKIVLTCVQEGIILPEDKLQGDFGGSFRQAMAKMRAQVHGRMSFGALFQEGVPFPAILLDSNLNLLWANRLFCEHWQLDETQIKLGNINWDTLAHQTNLGQMDPVVEGLKQQVAGIYQIQVRTPNQETFPYEMYVSPVAYGGQNRVMLFFYPLRSLEQTLADQKKAMITPVVKTLEQLSHNTFTPTYVEKVQEEFSGAGIEVILGKFQQLYQVLQKQQQAWALKVDQLTTRLAAAQKMIDDLAGSFDKEEAIHQAAVPHFEQTKNNIIILADARKEVEQLCLNAVAGSKDLLQEEMNLLAEAKNMEEMINENMQVFDTMAAIRNDFKTIRHQIDDCRSTLVQTIDQATVLKKTERWSPEKMEQILGRVKLEVKNFEAILGSLGKLSTVMDVQLSKLQMITENHHQIDVTPYQVHFEELREIIENSMFKMAKIARRGDQADKDVVVALKDLYQNYGEQKSNLAAVGQRFQAEGQPPALPIEQ